MENPYKYMEDDNFSIEALKKRGSEEIRRMTDEQRRQWYKQNFGKYPEEVKHSD